MQGRADMPCPAGLSNIALTLAKPLVLSLGQCVPWGGRAGPRQPGRLGRVMAGATASFLVNCYPLETPILLHASPLVQ